MLKTLQDDLVSFVAIQFQYRGYHWIIQNEVRIGV